MLAKALKNLLWVIMFGVEDFECKKVARVNAALEVLLKFKFTAE